MTDGDVRYHFNSWNAPSTSSVQTKGSDFHISLNNRRARSASLEMNRLRAVKHPVSFCTSLMQIGGCIASMVLIFSGLASILQCKTRKPSSFLAVTQNTHLSRFIFVRFEHNLSKTMVRLSSKDACILILTMISSTYTSIKSLLSSPNVLFMACTKVGRSFLRL
jgi:hypothetical protein